MAVDMFLKLEGIDGESHDHAHKKNIDILAWSWGASQGGTTHMGGGAGAGKATVNDISVTKYVDSASCALLQHVTTGKHIPKGRIIVRKAGDSPLEYINISMEDIIITSYQTGGSGGEDRLTENISLNFAKFGMYYTPQKADGSGDPDKEVAYDIQANDKDAKVPKQK
ncbi:MAG: type VI secretion system tube protein Hcp [Pseudomonadota bacterium]